MAVVRGCRSDCYGYYGRTMMYLYVPSYHDVLQG